MGRKRELSSSSDPEIKRSRKENNSFNLGELIFLVRNSPNPDNHVQLSNLDLTISRKIGAEHGMARDLDEHDNEIPFVNEVSSSIFY